MDILKKIPIVHLNTADSWRGGEKQTFYLASHLHYRGYLTYCICQKNSPLHEKLKGSGLPHFPVIMRSEIDFVAAKNISKLLKKIDASHAHRSRALARVYKQFFL
jgi:hypothetical protein